MKKILQFTFLLFIAMTVSNNAFSQYWFPQSGNELILKNNTNSVSPTRLGIGTTTPTAQLHTTDSVRHENLINTKDSFVVVIDPLGNIHQSHIDSLLQGRIPTITPGWLLTGNTVNSTDYIGTNNNQDFRIRTDNLQRARYTSDGNYELGFSNNFSNSGITHIGGRLNGSTNDSVSFVFGTQNTSGDNRDVGIIGANNTMANSEAVVVAGLYCNVDNANVGGVVGELLQMTNSHGSFMAGGHSFIDASPLVPTEYNMLLGSYNSIQNSRKSHIYGNDNLIQGSLGMPVNSNNNFAFGNHLAINNGNEVFVFGSNISNDLDSSFKFGFNNNRTMTLTEGGVGIQMFPGVSTYTPGHNLEVQAGSGTGPLGATTPEIMFQDLPVTSDTSYRAVVINPNTDELYRLDAAMGGGVNSSCSMPNIVPRVGASGTDLVCGQIYDDNASVGIGFGSTPNFSYTWSGGLSGPNPPAGILKLDVNGVVRGLAFMATSDETLKTDVKDIDDAGNIIQQLAGKKYKWNQATINSTGADNSVHYGFMAQELAKVVPEAVIVDDAGKHAVNYDAIIPILVESQKSLMTKLEKQEKDIADLKSKNAYLDSLFQLNILLTDNDQIILKQNVPNPFSNNTSIGFIIPARIKSAQIVFKTLSGTNIHIIDVKERGAGVINVQQNDLSSGMYLYSLIADGQLIDTKKMTYVK